MAEEFLVIGDTSFYGSNFRSLVEHMGHRVHRMSLRTWTPDEIKGDYVVNFAAANLPAESWKYPADYMLANVVAIAELLDLLRHKPIKKYVHVSTPEVIGSCTGWLSEDLASYSPSTPYAVSRAAAEMLVKTYHEAYNFPSVITRTSNIYGPGQSSNRIIPKALECKKRGIELELDGGGKSIRNFIHVRDACEATYLAAISGRPGETYHISGWRTMTIVDIVTMVGCKWKSSTERLGKDYAYKLDSTKIRKLGWMDKISLEEGLKECESAISV